MIKNQDEIELLAKAYTEFNSLKFLDCPICKYNCAKILHCDDILYDGFYYSYKYHLCKICGFVFQQRRHERNHYEKLPCQFPVDYEEHTFRRAAYIFNFCWSDRVECSSFIQSINSILDIGCGHGGVMKNLKKIFPFASICGYTLDMEEPEVIDLKIKYQNIEDSSAVKDSRYDLIIMSHVVEHFYDLDTAMKNVHKLLADDGFLYIEVPSFHWCEVRTPTVWCPEHLSFFTKNSLSNLLALNGFKIIKIKDSRYWGNIKVLVQKHPIKSLRYRYRNDESGWWTMTKHFLAKASYPYYRVKRWLFNPAANE